ALVILAGVLLVPVQNAADERRDQRDLRLRARHGLVHPEQQRHIAVDAFLLQYFGGFDAFPCGGELDQDALAGDAGLLILRDDVARRGDGLLRVVGDARIHLGRDAARNNLQNLQAEGDGEGLEGLRGDLLVAGIRAGLFAGLHQDAVHDGSVRRHGGRRGDQRRIGGGIGRLELFDGVDIAGVRHDSSHAAKLLEKCGHGGSFAACATISILPEGRGFGRLVATPMYKTRIAAVVMTLVVAAGAACNGQRAHRKVTNHEVRAEQEQSWTAKWITAPWSTERDGAELDGSRPMPIFRREFTLKKNPVSATLRIAGLGQYELHLNGAVISKPGLHQSWTDYRKTITYDSYDVTKTLKPGANAIGVLLGNGMYNVQRTVDKEVLPRGERYTKFVGSFGVPKSI